MLKHEALLAALKMQFDPPGYVFIPAAKGLPTKFGIPPKLASQGAFCRRLVKVTVFRLEEEWDLHDPERVRLSLLLFELREAGQDDPTDDHSIVLTLAEVRGKSDTGCLLVDGFSEMALGTEMLMSIMQVYGCISAIAQDDTVGIPEPEPTAGSGVERGMDFMHDEWD